MSAVTPGIDPPGGVECPSEGYMAVYEFESEETRAAHAQVWP
jgi:hypothetical protein